jgi:hypothetical protein
MNIPSKGTAAGARDVWQQVAIEFQVPLAVKVDHRDTIAALIQRPNLHPRPFRWWQREVMDSELKYTIIQINSVSGSMGRRGGFALPRCTSEQSPNSVVRRI